MWNKKLKILDTYKRTAMIPFDSIESRIAFTFKHDLSKLIEIDVSWRILIAIVIINVCLCLWICFLFFEANTFVEYSDTFFPIATILIGFSSCILQVIARSKVIELIYNFEMVIEERKPNQHELNY